MNYLLIITLGLLSLLPLHGQQTAQPYAEATLTSKHLIPGEQTNLIVRLHGAQPDRRPTTPEIPNTSVNFVRAVTQLDTQRQLIQVFLYRLTPAKSGKYIIPPFEMSSGGKKFLSPPVSFEVHDPTKLITLPTGVSGHNILAGWFPDKKTLYQGEQCLLVLKLYAPQQLRLASWGLPDPVKENCLAWRFSPPPTNELGRVHINGVPHLSAKYQTTLSGISPGTATFGPSKTRIVIRQRVIDPRFGPRISDIPVELTLPPVKFEILPFPDGAPDDFQGAVGQFQIRAHCSKLTLNDTETTEVILQVGGTGNLENIKPPVISGDEWKIIDTSKITRGEERRFASGVVTFRQLIRPEKGTPSSIPPYSLSYFNPDDKKYHTLTTTAIPVNVIATSKGVAASNAAGTEQTGTSPDEMRGILGFLDKPNLQTANFTSQVLTYWHIIPATLCLFLIGIPLIRKIKSLTVKHPDDQQKQLLLKKLSTPSDTRTFYRRAGRFIDQWLTPNEELNNILAERDQVCFLPDDTDVEDLPEERKHEIIHLLKRCSKLTLTLLLPLLFLFALSPQVAQASREVTSPPASSVDSAKDAWKAGKYQQAIDLYQDIYPNPDQTPADILYNIGNCHHRLKQYGRAALSWRRALAINPTHQKARQNLRYLEIEQGSFVPDFETWQQYLTFISPQTYRTVVYASLWSFLIILLWLIFTKPRHKIIGIILLFFMPITATLGALGVYYYPDSDFHTPFNQQAVSLQKISLYEEAHRQESDPAQLPPASYIRILAKRGSWCHIETSDNQSGWVRLEDIGIIQPQH